MVRKAMRLPAVLEATGYSKASWYAKIADGIAPKGLKLDPNGRAVVWFEDDIEALQTKATKAAKEVA